MTIALASETVGSGPPLIVLHGLFGSRRNWRSVAVALAKTHTVYCLDLRNHGESGWASTMSYEEMADDVLAFIEHEKLKGCTLLGHSMGGKVAMALALINAQAVQRLIVVDIAPISYPDRFSSFASVMQSINTKMIQSRPEVQRLMNSAIADPGIVGFLMQNLVPFGEHYDWRLNLAAISAAMPSLGGFPAQLSSQVFCGPTSLIYGTTSNYVSENDFALMKAYFPSCEFFAVAGAGHWVHAEKPQAFLQALNQSLTNF
jgi:esterase